MLACNYSRNIPLFKGFTVKNFKENSSGSYEVFLEMPKTDHIYPHCGHSTSYVKDYRIQIIKDTKIGGRDLFIFENGATFVTIAAILLLNLILWLKDTSTLLQGSIPKHIRSFRFFNRLKLLPTGLEYPLPALPDGSTR